MFTDASIDIHNLDGYTDGVLSHKYAQTTPTRPAWCGDCQTQRSCGRDLMWPYRDEVAGLLRKDKDKDGTVHINDIYAAKVSGEDSSK